MGSVLVNKTKVEEWRVLDVLRYSQPYYNRVVYSRSKPDRPGIWIMKTSRERVFSARCDRAAKEAIARGWCELNEAASVMRPTALGEKVLKENGWWLNGQLKNAVRSVDTNINATV